MDLLAKNYQWIFSGIGVLIIGLIIQRWISHNQASSKVSSSANVDKSAMSNSPVASGQNNTQTAVPQSFHAQTIHIGQAGVAVPAAAPGQPTTKTQRPLPNIVFGGARPVHVAQTNYGVWSEGFQDERALVVQFTNEARAGQQNVGGPVKARVAYKDADVELLAITGCWLNQDADWAEFRVDDTHGLMVGLMRGGQFTTVAKRRNRVDLNSDEIQTHTKALVNFSAGIVSVRLTHASTGEVLYQGEFHATVNPLAIVPL